MKYINKYKGFFLIELMVSILLFSTLILVINGYISNLGKLNSLSNKAIENFINNYNNLVISNSSKRSDSQIDSSIVDFRIGKNLFKVLQKKFKNSDFKIYDSGIKKSDK